jgi:hypothetical protein
MKNKQRHWPAALASFMVVGLGQIIKGEGRKGLKLLLIFYFALPVAIYTSLLINGYLFLVTLGLVLIAGFCLWLYSVWDAFRK